MAIPSLLLTLTILATLTTRPVSAQIDSERLRILQLLAESLASQFGKENPGSFPCVLATPYGADSMLMSAPAHIDSTSRTLVHDDSSRSSFLRELLSDSSADPASLDSTTLVLLGSLAHIIRESNRTIDTTDVRELGIFSFRLLNDSAVLGLAYGGYWNAPTRNAFWDASGYRFQRAADVWRVTTDSALFFMDGMRFLFTGVATTRLKECLR